MSTKLKSRSLGGIYEKDVLLWINITLVGVITLLFFYYVTMANSIAAKNYKIQALREKAELLSEANGSLMSKKVVLDSPTTLLEFAQASNLVEAKNVVYIFENRSVAKR